ncbi:hypothetical protein KFL_016790010 [Klebsormidium nitens]|uniref:WRC domain-containing protein n=1 Tax=Klebsormidium nitens TaxID=105231 RepID=A0A1Y1IRQ9_KLENI|nr:hypothetical protein KFL_016790010 [Klebsormidium nitens]|eukprot:GAQ93585.1 hypothetical protein KFL_016790010 [Klebsormidium nitens]
MELTLKGGEPAEEHLGSAAREDPQGMGNAEVPEPPTVTRKRSRMLRELESRLKDTEDTVSFSQGQGQEDQTTSPISKPGRRRATPSQWWGNQISAPCPYSKEKAPGKRRKGVKAPKSPGQQSSNAAVPDEQRCNRSDGKKWRCSKQRAFDRKVCEDHRQSRKKPSARKAGTNSGTARKKGRGRSVTDAGSLGGEEGQADGKAPSGFGGSRSAGGVRGAQTQGGAERVVRGSAEVAEAGRARGDDVSKGPNGSAGTRVRASKRRWWEANGSGATGEKGKRLEQSEGSDGLPLLKEDASEGEIVGARASDIGVGANETVPRVDQSRSEGPPGPS